MAASDEQRVVLISGGASGIGRCIAERFLQDGFAAHVCDASDANVADFLLHNADASATVADVSNPADVERVFEDLSSNYDALHVLINNAGIAGPTAAVQDIAIDDWDRCIGVDLNGAFYMARKAVPLLRDADRGSIINIASTAALFGYPLRSPYAAAKWAQVGLTKTWAMELGAEGIRVNAICPGSVEGDRIDAVIRRDAAERGIPVDDVRDVYLRQASMRTFVSAEDIADLAIFLASDKAGKISGQIMSVDGHTESMSNWLD